MHLIVSTILLSLVFVFNVCYAFDINGDTEYVSDAVVFKEMVNTENYDEALDYYNSKYDSYFNKDVLFGFFGDKKNKDSVQEELRVVSEKIDSQYRIKFDNLMESLKIRFPIKDGDISDTESIIDDLMGLRRDYKADFNYLIYDGYGELFGDLDSIDLPINSVKKNIDASKYYHLIASSISRIRYINFDSINESRGDIEDINNNYNLITKKDIHMEYSPLYSEEISSLRDEFFLRYKEMSSVLERLAYDEFSLFDRHEYKDFFDEYPHKVQNKTDIIKKYINTDSVSLSEAKLIISRYRHHISDHGIESLNSVIMAKFINTIKDDYDDLTIRAVFERIIEGEIISGLRFYDKRIDVDVDIVVDEKLVGIDKRWKDYDVYVIKAELNIDNDTTVDVKYSKYHSGMESVHNPAYEDAEVALERAKSNFQYAQTVWESNRGAVIKWGGKYEPDTYTRNKARNSLQDAKQRLDIAILHLGNTPLTIRTPSIKDYSFNIDNVTVLKTVEYVFCVVNKSSNNVYVYQGRLQEGQKFKIPSGIHDKDIMVDREIDIYQSKEELQKYIDSKVVISGDVIYHDELPEHLYSGKYLGLDNVFSNIGTLFSLPKSGANANVNLVSDNDFTNNHSVDDADPALFVKAMNEIENSTYDKSIWVKSFALSEGNLERQKAIYIKLRVKQLMGSMQ